MTITDTDPRTRRRTRVGNDTPADLSAMTTDELADYAIDTCRNCQGMAPEAREMRKRVVLADIAKARARELTPLGTAAWPLGRPWAEHY